MGNFYPLTVGVRDWAKVLTNYNSTRQDQYILVKNHPTNSTFNIILMSNRLGTNHPVRGHDHSAFSHTTLVQLDRVSYAHMIMKKGQIVRVSSWYAMELNLGR